LTADDFAVLDNVERFRDFDQRRAEHKTPSWECLELARKLRLQRVSREMGAMMTGMLKAAQDGIPGVKWLRENTIRIVDLARPVKEATPTARYSKLSDSDRVTVANTLLELDRPSGKDSHEAKKATPQAGSEEAF
jgi:hypothetical protein